MRSVTVSADHGGRQIFSQLLFASTVGPPMAVAAGPQVFNACVTVLRQLWGSGLSFIPGTVELLQVIKGCS